MDLSIAEINEYPIAHVLGDKAAKATDRLGDNAMVSARDIRAAAALAGLAFE